METKGFELTTRHHINEKPGMVVKMSVQIYNSESQNAMLLYDSVPAETWCS